MLQWLPTLKGYPTQMQAQYVQQSYYPYTYASAQQGTPGKYMIHAHIDTKKSSFGFKFIFKSYVRFPFSAQYHFLRQKY